VWLILQVRGRLRLAQNATFFSWMRLRVFWMLRPSIAAFLCCLLSWHPGHFRFHRFSRRFHRSDPWRTFLVLFLKWMSTSLVDVLRLGDWSQASTFFRFYRTL
jgi:hypothetical protein